MFLTTKKNGQELRHLGWFPYELLDEGLRARLTRLYLPGPHTPDRARRIQALKDEILLNLDNRRDAATDRIVFHFESDQLILLDEVSGRDWEFSFMTTHVSGDNEVDLDAFLNTPLRGLPVNSHIYKSEVVHPAAYETCEENCCANQLSQALNLDYARVWDEFRERALRHTRIPGSSITSPWRWC